MPQGPINTTIATQTSGNATKGVSLLVDSVGALEITNGGVSSTLNITGAATIKASAARVAKVSVIAPGSTSGNFTINDSNSTGNASGNNVIWQLAYNATANVKGALFTLDWPCANGLTVSEVPGGGSPVIAVSWS